jgi:small-conductance mechanosensitive channel/CRP-like cAMP-binding protein
MLGSPVHPRFDAASRIREFWEQLLETTWWLLAARAVVVLASLAVAFKGRSRQTKLAADLVAGAIYIATLLAILNFVFEVPIGGMLATSGVIAVVLGLALQSTLSDVFSGIALGLERPYRLGDLVWIEGNIEGYVNQINWRSTHVRTEQNDVAIVPNSIMAKARVINRSSPSLVQGDTISVILNAAATVEQSLVVLNAAISACLMPVSHPDSSIICSGLHGDGTVYTISFFAGSSELLPAVRDEIFTHISRHLRYAGILLGVAGIVVPSRVQLPAREQLLEWSDLFGPMAAPERDQLASHFSPQWLKPGDVFIREGEMPGALFLIASGTAEITRIESGRPAVLFRVSPGEILGALNFISQKPYTATVTALTSLTVYRLGKEDLSSAIKATPELAKGLEVLAQRGIEALHKYAINHEEVQMAKPEAFLMRLRSFLGSFGSPG